MGPFPYIVVQDLKFEDGEFNQTNTYFTERSFVSWDSTNEQPNAKNDEWHWLAGNTVRIRKRYGNRRVDISQQFDTRPVTRSPKRNTYEYRQSWKSDDEGIVHLALPRHFSVNISSLDGHMPFHAKFDRGRICLDWFTIQGDPTDFTFELIKYEGYEFEKRATEFARDIQPRLKRTEKEADAASRYGISNGAAEKTEGSTGGLEYWLKIVGLIVTAVSGVIVAIPQASGLIGPFDYTAEALLIVCVLGVVVFGLGLILGKPWRKRRGIIGVTAIVVAPVIAWWLWYSFLQLSPTEKERVRREVALGDAELLLGNPSRAREHYGNAALLAPRRGSIRAKMQDAEARMRSKRE